MRRCTRDVTVVAQRERREAGRSRSNRYMRRPRAALSLTTCATSPLVNPITRLIGVFLREILFASGVASFGDSEALCDCENNVVDIIERRLIKLAFSQESTGWR